MKRFPSQPAAVPEAEADQPLVRREPRRGATAIEYAFLVSLICVAVILAVRQLGLTNGALFDRSADTISEAQGADSGPPPSP